MEIDGSVAQATGSTPQVRIGSWKSLARWRNAVPEERPPESVGRRVARIARRVLLVVAGVLLAVAFALWESYRKRWPLTDDQNASLIVALIAAFVVFWAALSLWRRLRPPF